MLTSEPLSGYALASRLAELKSQNALIVSLAVGDTNAQWVIGYHAREAELIPEVHTHSKRNTTTQATAAVSTANAPARNTSSKSRIAPPAQSELW